MHTYKQNRHHTVQNTDIYFHELYTSLSMISIDIPKISTLCGNGKKMRQACHVLPHFMSNYMGNVLHCMQAKESDCTPSSALIESQRPLPGLQFSEPHWYNHVLMSLIQHRVSILPSQCSELEHTFTWNCLCAKCPAGGFQRLLVLRAFIQSIAVLLLSAASSTSKSRVKRNPVSEPSLPMFQHGWD